MLFIFLIKSGVSFYLGVNCRETGSSTTGALCRSLINRTQRDTAGAFSPKSSGLNALRLPFLSL